MSTSAKIGEFGASVSGLAEKHQFIRTICHSQRGSIPQDPFLGVDWLAVLDLPLPEAIPIVSLDVQMQLKKYAPTIEVRAIEVLSVEQRPGKARVLVTWRPLDEERATDEVTEVA